MSKMMMFTILSCSVALAQSRTTVRSLVCKTKDCGNNEVLFEDVSPTAASLGKKAFHLPPLGDVAPQGWMLNQLLVQANALSGYMATSTFPGAITVNESQWLGGNYSTSTLQWLPYWTNGNVPLLELIRAANAEDKLDPGANFEVVVEQYVNYVLLHTNKSNGWIGPFANEPGDFNGHGLWDPLNMLRTLLNYAQAHPDRSKEITKACVAHMTKEAQLLKTDPVYKWAQTRWPTYVEIALYIVDELVPLFGDDVEVMPLGAEGTAAMLINSSILFGQKGMDWNSYYHQTGKIKFPEVPVKGWNTNDHGVNNAEGALRYPAVSYRLTSNTSYHEEMDFVLGMLDKYQGQVQALFCADEVFCGREPHRGTETCTVVEAMASLEYAFETLGEPSLMDRVERLAFNAMPASLTGDMWTHVYVQQANSVFAGNTKPNSTTSSVKRGCGGRCSSTTTVAHGDHTHVSSSPDTPSGEDMGSNFFGVSHFPCCITNFPQGWPKFAMHAVLTEMDGSGFVVASLVPSKSTLKDIKASVTVDSNYPFDDVATVIVKATKAITAKIRIPGWATQATVNGNAVANGTFVTVACSASSTTVIDVRLNYEPRLEIGWGGSGTNTTAPESAAAVLLGPLVFALHPTEHKIVKTTYKQDLPYRDHAVDYEISTSATWNYALDLSVAPILSRKPSKGWSPSLPFSEDEFPFSIEMTARKLPGWGYWNGSMITDSPPPSPVDCTTMSGGCGNSEPITLVPFGGTNIRISVFPWIK